MYSDKPQASTLALVLSLCSLILSWTFVRVSAYMKYYGDNCIRPDKGLVTNYREGGGYKTGGGGT